MIVKHLSTYCDLGLMPLKTALGMLDAEDAFTLFISEIDFSIADRIFIAEKYHWPLCRCFVISLPPDAWFVESDNTVVWGSLGD